MKRHTAITMSIALALANANLATAHELRGYFQQHNLVSDGTVAADHIDPNLGNPWGIAFNPFGVVWVADNHTGLSTLYDGAGVPQSLVVQIPTPTTSDGGAASGTVFNASNNFVLAGSSTSGPSRFLFATEDGVIAGWAPAADGTHALKAIDNSGNGAVYKGLALGAGGSGQLLYATDFHNARVDVFDGNFHPVTLAASAFSDHLVPTDYAPFGIQAINGNIYVTFAKQDADRHDNVSGQGLGYVDAFDPNGVLLQRVVTRGNLNAPWGIALAPPGFGGFSNALLIGNFGDGKINAYDPVTRRSLGQLRGQDQQPIQIDGLWGLSFGNGFASQSVNTLFFTAGPNEEANGLYGRLDAVGGNNDDSDD